MSASAQNTKAICAAVKATFPSPADVTAQWSRLHPVTLPAELTPTIEAGPGVFFFVNGDGEFITSSSFPVGAIVLNPPTESTVRNILEYTHDMFGDTATVVYVPNTNVTVSFCDHFNGGSSRAFFPPSAWRLCANHRDHLTRKMGTIDRIDAAAATSYCWSQTQPPSVMWAQVLGRNDFEVVGIPDASRYVAEAVAAGTVYELVPAPAADVDDNSAAAPSPLGTLHMLGVPIARTGYDDDDDDDDNNQSPNLLDDDDESPPLEIGVWFPSEYTQFDRDARPILPFISANIPYADVANETGYDTLLGPIDTVVGHIKPGYCVDDTVEPNSIHDNVPSTDPRVHIRVVDLTGRSAPAGPSGRRNPVVEIVVGSAAAQ